MISQSMMLKLDPLQKFLKSVDRFNDLVVSVYVTAGHILLSAYMWCLFREPKSCVMSWQKKNLEM
uniref:Uncharacterized protein n=1 Tax=Triticum urartu TaxID=4572 RepID=A0A8R7QSE3_TRIUA